MSIEKAKNHFLGKAGHKRLNCAEAILKAFNELDPSEQESICKGSGRSPNNECGALCAAKSILKEHDPEKVGELEGKFIKAAGSGKCDEIRKLRKLSCIGCVEKAAELLHKRLIFQNMGNQVAS
ncbi:MAG: hypothetical protein WC624_06735 [Candidatus Margulisiibacteriota bacterium]